jgi:hypothetical protein
MESDGLGRRTHAARRAIAASARTTCAGDAGTAAGACSGARRAIAASALSSLSP